jgi:endoribonuclease Dicer
MSIAALQQLPRLYQHEVMKEAAQRNSIIRMDTGAGKTLCAIMLIRHISSLAVDITLPRKLQVFIVPTVSLVHQQSKVIISQTTLRVKSFVGALGVDYWKTEDWTKQLDEADIVVCTAQIWLNVLINGYFSMERTSLIIFDEAHHCSKKHPYCLMLV